MFDEYLSAHISPEPAELQAVRRDTWLHRLYPQMCIGHAEGRLLKMLTAMIAPCRVLEIGTFSGYSALCMAEALVGDATVDSVEIDDEAETPIRRALAASPHGARVRLHIGDALEVVPRLGGPWDMVYIDANKRLYPQYLDTVLPRLSPGAYILADNTLWGGKVADPACHDAQTEGIREFNRRVAADPSLEKAMIALRDGLTLIRLIPANEENINTTIEPRPLKI